MNDNPPEAAPGFAAETAERMVPVGSETSKPWAVRRLVAAGVRAGLRRAAEKARGKMSKCFPDLRGSGDIARDEVLEDLADELEAEAK